MVTVILKSVKVVIKRVTLVLAIYYIYIYIRYIIALTLLKTTVIYINMYIYTSDGARSLDRIITNTLYIFK